MMATMPSKKTGEPVKLAAFFSHPVQYFAPVFRRLAARPEVDLTVFYQSNVGMSAAIDPGFGVPVRWDVPLLEGYRSKFLGPTFRAVPAALDTGHFDVVLVSGWGSAWAWRAYLGAFRRRLPVLAFGDTNLLSPRPWSRRLIRELLYPWLFSKVAGALYIGRANRALYEHFGVDETRLFYAPYCVDNEFFQRAARKLPTSRAALRSRFGMSAGVPVILFCGKLIDIKQPLLLLEAFANVRRRLPCGLLFAGDGPLRAQIQDRAASRHIPDVHVTGFLNQTKVVEAYASADVLVLPSASESWGLVINEAMNFGLPVIASDRVGAVHDLVIHGDNGFVFPSGDVDALSAALSTLVQDSDRRTAMGRRSGEMVDMWSPERFVDGVVRACTAVSGETASIARFRLPRGAAGR